MSFVELGKLMNTSWQDCDDFAKSVFRELAEEGRRDYRQRLEKYNAYLSSNPQAAEDDAKKKNAKKDKLSKKASLPSSLPGVELKRNVSGYNYNSSAMNEEKSGHQSFKRHVSDTPSHGTSVPTGYGVYADDDEPKTDVSASSTYDTEEDLHASIKGLEDQLSSARLKLRVVELENRLARQKAVEDQLRAQIQLSSLNGHASHQAPSARDLQRDADGLLSLLNATRNDSYNPDSFQGNKKQRRS
jgi:hypothetical protein